MWKNFEQSPMGLCEKPVDSLISTPANTWSNVPFIIVGIYILSRYKEQLSKHPRLKIIPIGAILVGVFSFIYHASYSLEFMVLENIVMVLFTSFMLGENLRRLFRARDRAFWILSLVIFAIVGFALFIINGFGGTFVFAGSYLLAVLLEVPIKVFRDDISSLKYFVLYIVFFAIAAVFWGLDRHGIICDPDNHVFQEHVIWHVSNAISIFFIYKHYALRE